MILGAHQPDLFPYPGFFKKMARSDVFDLAIHDQFQSKGYQRRVKMRGQWVSLPLDRSSLSGMICDVRIAPGGVDALRDAISGRYRAAKFFDTRWPLVDVWIKYAANSELLWRFNASLIWDVADWLGLKHNLYVSAKPKGKGVDGLLSMCSQYEDVTAYLSGTGGHAYMGPDPERRFAEQGLQLLWNDWEPPTSDSILTLIFDDENPWRWFAA